MKTPTNSRVAVGLRLYRAPAALAVLRLPAEHLAELRQDIRYGLRMLARSPGFTSVALISLALGIGIATSAFSDLNGLVLRNVPGVAKPGELHILKEPASFVDYRRYKDLGVFSSAAAYAAPVPFAVGPRGQAERIWGHLVTPSYFPALGVRTALGRVFGEEEERPGRSPVVVVSHRYWEEHMGSDAAAVGKPLRINGQTCTIVGVGPKDFLGASPLMYGADLWLPVSVGARVAPELADNALDRHDLAIFHVIGRLRPGLQPAAAEAALEATARRLEREYGDLDRDRKGRRVTLRPGGRVLPVRDEDLPLITGYLGVLGSIVLLIACSNVANMMLARAADRRKEIAVRLALGAGRGRLIRQLLTESMLISAGAGAAGFVMAMWLMHLASEIRMPFPMPLQFDLTPDTRVFVFTLALTVLTGLAFGLVPALQATRPDLTPALKEGGNVQLRRYRRISLRNALVLSQLAGSLALLLITGFLVLGHRRIAGVDVGFDARGLYLISIDPIRDGYTGEQAAAFFPKLLDRVKRLPSVRAATLTDSVPMGVIGKPGVPFLAAGRNAEDPQAVCAARRYVVGADYLETVGIPILAGRGFHREDEAPGSTAAIVNDRWECWKGQDPLGRRLQMGNEEVPEFRLGGVAPPRRTFPAQGRKLEVVGVAKGVREGLDITAKGPPVIYMPLRPADYARPTLNGLILMVRAAPGADAIGAVRREIAAMDANLTPFNARSMPEQIEQMMLTVNSALWTYGCIGICGLILASVGLAGVTAYSVTQRRREIGIRMAMGARSVDVLGLVMKEGGALVVVGTAIGLACAWAGMRMLASVMSMYARVSGTSATDPALLAGAPLLLAALALAACYVPARKSMRIDPAITLRQE